MKQVHNARFRVIDHDKETVKRLFDALLAQMGIDRKLVELRISRDESDEPVFLGELWMDRQQPVRKTLAFVKEHLPQAQQQHIAQHPEKFIDIATHCFLRLDREDLEHGKLNLTTRPDSVHLRFNIAAFPATKENAVPIVRAIFSNTL